MKMHTHIRARAQKNNWSVAPPPLPPPPPPSLKKGRFAIYIFSRVRFYSVRFIWLEYDGHGAQQQQQTDKNVHKSIFTGGYRRRRCHHGFAQYLRVSRQVGLTRQKIGYDGINVWHSILHYIAIRFTLLLFISAILFSFVLLLAVFPFSAYRIRAILWVFLLLLLLLSVWKRK